MQILLADAKLMHQSADRESISTPLFQAEADMLAAEMSRMTADELQHQFGCGASAAEEARVRFARFATAKRMPAILAYNGQAYKHLLANTLDAAALAYGQEHLWITSFLYGMLRPLDGIAPYRMEQGVTLEATDDRPVSQWWRDRLTDRLIAAVKADDGVLLHLSTAEYQQLFHWRRVEAECRVVQPLFYVDTGRALKMQAVWAKSCRGAMTRYVLQNRLTSPDQLEAFTHEGFTYAATHGDPTHPYFLRHPALS